MKYKGIELNTSDKPVVFNPARPMIVWDDNQFPEKRFVEAYLPGLYFPVILPTGRTVYCAEIPDKMKPKRMTNRQLAEWLAQGNGQFTNVNATYAWTELNVLKEKEDRPCVPEWRIRKWEDTEWHEPTVDYMGLEDLA